MLIPIANPYFNTIIFAIIFWGLVIASIRVSKDTGFFAPFKTSEMKGFAILAIIFSHIGYFLSTDTNFLWPMSVLAGVGVNLFLFLSGFGLTLSGLSKPLSIQTFYFKRLRKLFVPLWIIVTIFLLADYLLLSKVYEATEIWHSLAGFFPVADLFKNLNSPLWYFSLIFFYYLIFPLTFFRKAPYVAPILILSFSYYLLRYGLPFDLNQVIYPIIYPQSYHSNGEIGVLINKDVLNLYKTHFAAFPLGILFAVLISDKNLSHIKFHFKEVFLNGVVKYLLIGVFVFSFGYFSIESGVGEGKLIEQTTSLITMFSVVFLFVIKNFEIKLFSIFGVYSYEIYLIHWPILSRYDFLYKNLPAWMATCFYLALFLAIGWALHKLVKKLTG